MPVAIGRDKIILRAVLAPGNVNLYETLNKAYDDCLVRTIITLRRLFWHVALRRPTADH